MPLSGQQLLDRVFNLSPQAGQEQEAAAALRQHADMLEGEDDDAQLVEHEHQRQLQREAAAGHQLTHPAPLNGVFGNAAGRRVLFDADGEQQQAFRIAEHVQSAEHRRVEEAAAAKLARKLQRVEAAEAASERARLALEAALETSDEEADHRQLPGSSSAPPHHHQLGAAAAPLPSSSGGAAAQGQKKGKAKSSSRSKASAPSRSPISSGDDDEPSDDSSDSSDSDVSVADSEDERKYPSPSGGAAPRPSGASSNQQFSYSNPVSLPAHPVAIFTGMGDTTAYLEWVFNVERQAAMYTFGSWKQEFALISRSMSQFVYEWFTSLEKQRAKEGKQPICGWGQLKKHMSVRFERQFDGDAAIKEFIQGNVMKQKSGETMAVYEARITLLRSRLDVDQVNESIFMEALIAGLATRYAAVQLKMAKKLRRHRRSHGNQVFSLHSFFKSVHELLRYSDITEAPSHGGTTKQLHSIGRDSTDSSTSAEDMITRLAAMGWERTAKGARAAQASAAPTATIDSAIHYTDEELVKWKPLGLCFKCGGTGHIARGCQQPRRDLRSMNLN
jgi:hypothetical protein